MSKKIILPKEFAQKWIEALRSGNYKQGFGRLLQEQDKNEKTYCCLGVACDVLKIDEEFIRRHAMPSGLPSLIRNSMVPTILWTDQARKGEDVLQNILANLNDGFPDSFLDNLQTCGYIIPENKQMFDFNDIANFLEANVEFEEEANVSV